MQLQSRLKLTAYKKTGQSIVIDSLHMSASINIADGSRNDTTGGSVTIYNLSDDEFLFIKSCYRVIVEYGDYRSDIMNTFIIGEITGYSDSNSDTDRETRISLRECWINRNKKIKSKMFSGNSRISDILEYIEREIGSQIIYEDDSRTHIFSLKVIEFFTLNGRLYDNMKDILENTQFSFDYASDGNVRIYNKNFLKKNALRLTVDTGLLELPQTLKNDGKDRTEYKSIKCMPIAGLRVGNFLNVEAGPVSGFFNVKSANHNLCNYGDVSFTEVELVDAKPK